jgi:hypothetical protein
VYRRGLNTTVQIRDEWLSQTTGRRIRGQLASGKETFWKWPRVQKTEPADFVIATGESCTLFHFAEIAFQELGLDPHRYIRTDKSLLRPSEIRVGRGDPSMPFKDWVGLHARESRCCTALGRGLYGFLIDEKQTDPGHLIACLRVTVHQNSDCLFEQMRLLPVELKTRFLTLFRRKTFQGNRSGFVKNLLSYFRSLGVSSHSDCGATA